MPTVSRFLGITVSLYYNDHPPAHFHAEYQGFKVKVAIETGEVTEGRFPVGARRVLLRWAEARREQLMENWRRARADEPLERIAGADVD
jgi:hypothetical protein